MLVSGVSEVFVEEFETLTTSSLRTFREEVQGYMQQPPASSTCPDLYSLVSFLTPHMGPYMLAQLAQGAFLMEPFNDPSVVLDSAVHVGWFLPPNPALPAYQEAEAAALLPQRPSLKSSDGKMPLFGKLTDVMDIISALLHFSACFGIMAKASDAPDTLPAMSFLCEMMARTLHSTEIRNSLMLPFDQARVRCHHAFALVHEVLSKCLRSMTHFRAKSAAVNQGSVPAAPVGTAFSFVDESFPRRLTDLSYLALDDKSLATFAVFSPNASRKADARAPVQVRYLLLLHVLRADFVIITLTYIQCYHVLRYLGGFS